MTYRQRATPRSENPRPGVSLEMELAIDSSAARYSRYLGSGRNANANLRESFGYKDQEILLERGAQEPSTQRTGQPRTPVDTSATQSGRRAVRGAIGFQSSTRKQRQTYLGHRVGFQ